MEEPSRVDLLVTRACEVVTAPTPGPRAGKAMDHVEVLKDGALAIRDGKIVAVGPSRFLEARFRPDRTFDASGCFALPGLVDAHTHPVFVGTREEEFDQRLRGVDYEEITRRGGGIFRSVEDLRAADDATLERSVRRHLDELLAAGTTTIEAKSGYGLLWEHELRSLEILGAVAASHPLQVVPTFLGAHQMPKEYHERRQDFVRELVETMIPQVAQRELAVACDVFCDVGAYSVDEARVILRAARDHGLSLRIHAEELGPSGGADLAAELGAASADHLCHLTEATMARFHQVGVQPVLLPGTVFSLGLKKAPPARRMIEHDLAVVLATDFNPGTSYVQSLLLVVAFACQILKMTVAESITAVTANAAASLGLGQECGALLPGMRADVTLVDGGSHLLLGYRISDRPVARVIVGGEILDPETLRKGQRT